MPTTIAVQVRFVALSNKTEDDITNTWHFSVVTLPPSSTTLAAIRDALKALYNSIWASVPADWSNTIIMKMYDLSDPKPRAPITTYSVGLTPAVPGTSVIPRECCCVLSYKASQLSGTDMKRRRGRIYLPTLHSNAMASTGLIASTYIGAVQTAAAALLSSSTGATDWDWVVYSPTSGGSAVVVGGFVDDAPDIQRRRGRDSSSRVTF